MHGPCLCPTRISVNPDILTDRSIGLLGNGVSSREADSAWPSFRATKYICILLVHLPGLDCSSARGCATEISAKCPLIAFSSRKYGPALPRHREPRFRIMHKDISMHGGFKRHSTYRCSHQKKPMVPSNMFNVCIVRKHVSRRQYSCRNASDSKHMPGLPQTIHI
jgi:hypothetical protein